MAHLILIRHAKSAWNAKGMWTGWRDIGLSDEADEQIAFLAHHLQDLAVDATYSSALMRASETLRMLKEKLDLTHLPSHAHEALNERDYGIYTGRNKWEVKEEVGEEEFRKIRRSWDYPIPEGETLADVHDRIVPFYQTTLLPELSAGKNVLVVAHGNSLRALIKHLEDLTPEEVLVREVGVSEAHVYTLDTDGAIVGKEIRAENDEKGKL
jgi:2,3-bisphosphoglycerate-dependent phosphoglycerate mutase